MRLEPVRDGAGSIENRSPILSALIAERFALLVTLAGAYFLASKLGLELTLHPTPISTLWPPNALLLAALLLRLLSVLLAFGVLSSSTRLTAAPPRSIDRKTAFGIACESQCSFKVPQHLHITGVMQSPPGRNDDRDAPGGTPGAGAYR